MKNKHNKIVFILLSILGVMGLVATLIYIFHSSKQSEYYMFSY